MDSTLIRTSDWITAGQTLPINVTKRYGCFKTILVATKNQLDALLSRYSRVLVIRLDFHVIEYTPSNTEISKMLRRLKEWLAVHYQLENIGHLWVREMEKAKRQHYHLAIMLNGHKVRHPKRIIEWVDHYWQMHDQPKPYTPKNCYTMIHRSKPETYDKAFYRLSYLAKERGKGYKAPTANNYSTSRIKPK